MKNITLLLLLLASTLSAQRKTEAIESQTLKASREITIVTPHGYDSNTNKNRKYPLLLLLDGDYLLDPFAGTLSYTEYWNDLPQVIIVGISQNKKNERAMDCALDGETGLPTETGDNFFDFVATELMPYIEKKYRVAPFRIIAGHDLTAAYANVFLYKEQPLFNAYISLSPELGTDMEANVAERLAALQTPIFYYLATADGDVNRLQKKIKVLDEKIKTVANPALRYSFDNFSGATHYSLVTYAIPEALYHIFSSYQPISTIEYQEKIVTLKSGYVEYLSQKYGVMEKDLGVKIPIRLNDFKAIEAAILKNAAYEELKDLAGIASKNYPKTILSEYYTGLYYEKTGDDTRAIKAYMNSYNLNEIGEYTKDFMLEKAERLK